jgi:hypothetical protein
VLWVKVLGKRFPVSYPPYSNAFSVFPSGLGSTLVVQTTSLHVVKDCLVSDYDEVYEDATIDYRSLATCELYLMGSGQLETVYDNQWSMRMLQCPSRGT